MDDDGAPEVLVSCPSSSHPHPDQVPIPPRVRLKFLWCVPRVLLFVDVTMEIM